MNTTEESQKPTRKALVTAFEDLETAQTAVKKLLDQGFDSKQIELVTHSVAAEAPEIETPKVHETTSSSLVDGALEWGTLGTGIGAIAALVTPFPGLALALIGVGGLTGAIVGGMAGIEHAVEDDSVDLPTVDEYERLVINGHSLVVVLCNHDQAMKAEEVIESLPAIHRHMHAIHGHEFHEHPAKRT